MLADCGILAGTPKWDPYEALVLAFTPGVPLEWLYAALRLGHTRRRKLRDMIHAADAEALGELGRENSAGIVQGDGLKMLEAVCPGYSGPAPLWSQLELQADARSDAAIARELGVDRQKVRRWRVNSVFCPVSAVRLRPNRGVPLAPIGEN